MSMFGLFNMNRLNRARGFDTRGMPQENMFPTTSTPGAVPSPPSLMGGLTSNRTGGRVGGMTARNPQKLGMRGASGVPVTWLDENTYTGNDGRNYTIEFENAAGRSVKAQPGNKQGARFGGGAGAGSRIRKSMLIAAAGGTPRPGGAGVGGGRESGIDQLGRVLRTETEQMQAAADEQYGRNLAQERAMEETLRGINPSLVGTADANAGMLRDEAGRVGAAGDEAVSQYDQQAGDVRGRLDQDLKGVFGSADRADRSAAEALGYASRAEDAGVAAVRGYDVGSQENIAATMMGMEKRFQSQIQAVNNGLNPDGTRMTPEEQQAARRELQFETSQATSATVAGLRDQMQTTLANLRTSLGQIRLGAGQVALGAAASQLEGGKLREGAARTRADVGTNLAAGRLEAEKVRLGFKQLGSSLLEASANLQNQARATALQLEVAGRGDLAEMVRNNPKSIVSMFAGLLTLQEMATAPGGRNIPAIRGF